MKRRIKAGCIWLLSVAWEHRTTPPLRLIALLHWCFPWLKEE